VEDVLGYDWHDVVEESEQFWNRVLTTEKPRALWFSRRSATEYTTFLEGVWRLGDAPYNVVDITDLPIIHRRCRKVRNSIGRSNPWRIPTSDCLSATVSRRSSGSSDMDRAAGTRRQHSITAVRTQAPIPPISS
jgi:hypothetical protein